MAVQFRMSFRRLLNKTDDGTTTKASRPLLSKTHGAKDLDTSHGYVWPAVYWLVGAFSVWPFLLSTGPSLPCFV